MVYYWYTWLLLLFHYFTRFNYEVSSLYLTRQDGCAIWNDPQRLGSIPLTRRQFFGCDFPKVQRRKERVSSGMRASSLRGPAPRTALQSLLETGSQGSAAVRDHKHETEKMVLPSPSPRCGSPGVPCGAPAGTPMLLPRTPQGGYFVSRALRKLRSTLNTPKHHETVSGSDHVIVSDWIDCSLTIPGSALQMHQLRNEQLLSPLIFWFQLIANRPKLHINICVTNTQELTILTNENLNRPNSAN